MKLISKVISFSNKNGYFVIVPGYLRVQNITTNIPVIIVTKSSAIGICFFGYGGSLSATHREATWEQELNGNKKEIPSPLLRAKEEKEHLEKLLHIQGYDNLDCHVITVFTNPELQIKGISPVYYCTKDTLIPLLEESPYTNDKRIDPQEVGKKLGVLQYQDENLKPKKKFGRK